MITGVKSDIIHDSSSGFSNRSLQPMDLHVPFTQTTFKLEILLKGLLSEFLMPLYICVPLAHAVSLIGLPFEKLIVRLKCKGSKLNPTLSG